MNKYRDTAEAEAEASACAQANTMNWNLMCIGYKQKQPNFTDKQDIQKFEVFNFIL